MSQELTAHPSVAETIAQAAAASNGKGLFNLNAITKVVDVCPYCGGEMRVYIEPTEDTPPRCPAFCMKEVVLDDGVNKKRKVWDGCGYKEQKKREKVIVQDKYDEALKSEAIGFMKHNSIFTDSSIWTKTLNSYKEVDEETKMAKAKAETFVNDLLAKDSNAHIVLTGDTGTGKTHLSMGMIYRYLKLSGYKRKVMLISYRELLEQLKFAMNDDEARKKVTGEVMKEVKVADLVLVDDLGAQLGDPAILNETAKTGVVSERYRATKYDTDTLNSLFEARLEKATIVTTNLTSLTLKAVYGARNYSRIVNNVNDRFIVFKDTPDKRITGI